LPRSATIRSNSCRSSIRLDIGQSGSCSGKSSASSLFDSSIQRLGGFRYCGVGHLR
jgi:hypothetical protein